MNLSDIEGYTYSQKISQNKIIKKKEILRVISYTEKNKISDSNEISNRVIQILVQEKMNLIRRLFQIYLI